MGRNDQRRREAKARQHGSSPGAPAAAPAPAWASAGAPHLDELAQREIAAALLALIGPDGQPHPDGQRFVRAAVRVAERPGVAGWRRAVERALASGLKQAVGSAWRHGWQPVDVVRVAGRRLGGRQLGVVRDAIADELRGYATATVDPRWAAQLAEVEAQVWWRPDQTWLTARAEEANTDPALAWAAVVSTALEVLSMIAGLPRLEQLGPLPGTARVAATARPEVDDRILSRVRALLAKAESTTFAAEAETFTAGAQALMARHSIDLALLAALDHGSRHDPGGRRLGIDNPYEGPKAMLLNSVAKANRCRAVWSKELGFCTVVGFPGDLDAVEMLFTSLLVQATTAVTQAGSRTDAYGRSRTRAFRQSFLTAYASRIGERLTEATGAETAQAAAEPSGRNLLPVLAARDDAVEAAVSAMFPRLRQHTGGSVTDREGWLSGLSAADLASLSTGGQLPE